MKYVIEIPARLGSKRVEKKNVRLLRGKPMIWYTIDAAKNSIVDEIYVNSESEEIGKIALDNSIKFYKRKAEFAQDESTSDEFNYDFIKNIKPENLVMVNPVSPLINGTDINNVIKFYEEGNYDTVITVREDRLQAFCDEKPINFNPDDKLPMTQNISPIMLCAWSVCVWRSSTFIKSFEEKGHAVFSGKIGFYAMDPYKCVKISTEEDFQMTEAMMSYWEAKDLNK
ncbi:MAG: acylneuraminate cytidylyltransferase family protein [Pseudomonadota bacterium]